MKIDKREKDRRKGREEKKRIGGSEERIVRVAKVERLGR